MDGLLQKEDILQQGSKDVKRKFVISQAYVRWHFTAWASAVQLS